MTLLGLSSFKVSTKFSTAFKTMLTLSSNKTNCYEVSSFELSKASTIA